MNPTATLIETLVATNPKLLDAYRGDPRFKLAVDLTNQQTSTAGKLDVLLNMLADYAHDNHQLHKDLVSRRMRTMEPLLVQQHGDPLAT